MKLYLFTVSMAGSQVLLTCHMHCAVCQVIVPLVRCEHFSRMAAFSQPNYNGFIAKFPRSWITCGLASIYILLYHASMP